jgi:hypothetical protein
LPWCSLLKPKPERVLPLEVDRLIDDHFLTVARDVDNDDILFVRIDPCRGGG